MSFKRLLLQTSRNDGYYWDLNIEPYIYHYQSKHLVVRTI